MGRKIRFSLAESQFELDMTKIDRDKLYGRRETLAVGLNEQPLNKGYLDEWGSVVISATGMGYVDEDKNWCERTELIAVDGERNQLSLLPSSFDEPIELTQTAPLDELLAYEVFSVYTLRGFDAEALAERVGETDELYTFPFVYRAGYEAKKAFLQTVKEGLFMQVCVPAQVAFLGRPQRVELDEDDEDDDFDFGAL